MEILYTEDKKGLCFSNDGVLKGSELIHILNQIYSNSNFKNLKYCIYNHEDCEELDFSNEDIEKIVKISTEASIKNPDLVEIIVASSDLQFGIARMYHGHLAEGGFKTVLTRTLDEAYQYINQNILVNG